MFVSDRKWNLYSNSWNASSLIISRKKTIERIDEIERYANDKMSSMRCGHRALLFWNFILYFFLLINSILSYDRIYFFICGKNYLSVDGTKWNWKRKSLLIPLSLRNLLIFCKHWNCFSSRKIYNRIYFWFLIGLIESFLNQFRSFESNVISVAEANKLWSSQRNFILDETKRVNDIILTERMDEKRTKEGNENTGQ